LKYMGGDSIVELVTLWLKEFYSPLTGYLGRNKGRDGSDRFYFLRDLTLA